MAGHRKHGKARFRPDSRLHRPADRGDTASLNGDETHPPAKTPFVPFSLDDLLLPGRYRRNFR